jgi:hypothetical protein
MEQLAKKEEEDNELRKKEKEEEIEKKREKIMETEKQIKERAEERKKQEALSKMQLSKVLKRKPLHDKLSKKFETEVEMPELQKKKN